MNKTVYSLVSGLLVVGLNTYAMEEGAVEVAKQIVAEQTEIIKEGTSEVVKQIVTEQPAIIGHVGEAVKTNCHICFAKNLCCKFVTLCKRHPVLLATGVVVSAAVIVYNVVPAVREKIHALFGMDSSKQVDNIEFEAHVLPQEKVEEVKPA